MTKWITFRLFKRDKPTQHVKFVGLSLTTVIGTCLMILVPSSLFHHFEEWDYGTSVYYSFITLSTIGFGDYVAGSFG